MPEEDAPGPVTQTEEVDTKEAPPAAPGMAIMPLTKEAIEKYLSCQLDTHLNDATPRRNEKDHAEDHQEQWQLPPTLQHHPSNAKSFHNSDNAKDHPAQQKPDMPGTVDNSDDEESRAKLDAQRVVLLQRRLADQEKQTKLLIDRLQGRPNRGSNADQTQHPPAGANITAGLTAHATGAGGLPRRSNRDQKHRLEQALLDSASRAKRKAAEKDDRANGKEGSDAGGLSREVSRAPRSERNSGNSGARSHRGPDTSQPNSPRTSHGGEEWNGDGYSKSSALDSIERQTSELNPGKKRGKSRKDLVAVDEAAKVPLGRTKSGTEIDLETGLPKEGKKEGSFSWFYAIGFVVLIAVLLYASVVILQRFN